MWTQTYHENYPNGNTGIVTTGKELRQRKNACWVVKKVSAKFTSLKFSSLNSQLKMLSYNNNNNNKKQ